MSDALFSVENKICIVTGGLGQIGKNFVEELVTRGAKVAVFSRTVNQKRIDETFPPEKFDHSKLAFYAVDINKKETIEVALDAIEAAWGVPDVLVNNAGIDTQPSAPPEVSGPFEKFPEEVFREVVDVNLVGTFLMCQAVGARMVAANKGGSIINIGSIYGMLPHSGYLQVQGRAHRYPLHQARGLLRRQVRHLQSDPLPCHLLGQEGHPRQHPDPRRRLAQYPGRDLHRQR